MRVVHALERFFPDSSGGTEVYVSALASELAALGVDSVIAAAWMTPTAATYHRDGVGIFRYPGCDTPRLRQIRGEEPHDHFEQFTRWLERQPADVYHQHSWTLGCGLHHLRSARALGLPTVLTVHVPANICLRGTMMRTGAQQCTGEISIGACAPCWTNAKGVAPMIADVVARVPLPVSRFAKSVALPSRLLTALATPALVEAHQANFAEMIRLSDRIVAVCGWLYDALLANGVPAQKLVLSRQGTARRTPREQRANRADAPLRVGFIGRWTPTKGIAVLVDAVHRMPADAAIELHVHALPGGAPEELYRRQVLDIAAGDPRIVFGLPLQREEVLPALRSFDVLAVPSQWLETGPLVVLEAQSVGTPVLGSRLGGIAELVRHDVDGWLIAHDDVQQWKEALSALVRDRSVLDGLRLNAPAVRTMQDVAFEMSALYTEIHGKRTSAPGALTTGDFCG